MSARAVFLIAVLLAASADSFAANKDPLTDDTVVIKTEGSHNLLLPSDWPIKQENGRLAPAAVEEYLSMKFGQVRTKFTDTDARVDSLERRVSELESQQKALLKGLKALVDDRSNQQEAAHGQ